MFLDKHHIIMSSDEIFIQQVTKEMSLYMPIILLIFGTFGCVCNLITFTLPSLITYMILLTTIDRFMSTEIEV